MKKDNRLDGVQHYETPETFLCNLCCDMVIKGDTAAIVTTSYVDTDPIVDFGDEARTYNFLRLCVTCGGEECTIIHNS